MFWSQHGALVSVSARAARSNGNVRSIGRVSHIATLLTLFAACGGSAAADTRTWDGSTSALWSDPANWAESVAPVNGDALVFPSGAITTTLDNDISSLQLLSVSFGSSYVVGGQALTLGIGGLRVNPGGGTVTWNLRTTIATPPTGVVSEPWYVAPATRLEWNDSVILGGNRLVLDVAGVMDGAGTFDGAGRLEKDGEGELVLNSANSLEGEMYFDDGVVRVTHNGALGIGDDTLANSTTLGLSGALALDGVAIGNELLLVSGANGGGALRVVSDSSFGGRVLVLFSGSVMMPAGKTLTLLNLIGYQNLFTVYGKGTLVLAGPPTRVNDFFVGGYLGGSEPEVPTVRLAADNAISDLARVTLFPGTTLDLNGHTTTLGGLAGFGQVITGGGNAGLVFRPIQPNPFEGDVTFEGDIIGTGSLVFEGPHRQVLTGVQSFTGPTRIVRSQLTLRGANLHGPVTVDPQGTLSMFSESSVGSLTLAGGRLRLTENGSHLASSGDFVMLGGSRLLSGLAGRLQDGCAQLLVTGGVTVGGALDLTFFANGVPEFGATCTLINNDGADAVVGTFDGLPEGAILTFVGQPLRLSYVGGDGNDITLTVVRMYNLSEGAIGPFFDLDILLANPTSTPAPLDVTFLPDAGMPYHTTIMLAPMSRQTIRVDEIPALQGYGALSAVVVSTLAIPIVVERTMRWGESGYGAHTEKASVGTALQWFFAEGAQGTFSTYILLANPGDQWVNTTIDFLSEHGHLLAPRRVAVPPWSRVTLDAGELGLTGMAFGFTVTFDRPAVAERAMYFSNAARIFDAGHASAGVTAPATTWFLAEGATGAFFETYVLVANPTDRIANVTIRFLPDTGPAITKTKVVGPSSRLSINIEQEDPALANAAVATEVIADVPIVVERSQYWPDPFPNWHEAHNSFGATALGTHWGLAEGRAGGPANYQTYILLSNPGTVPATVSIAFLRTMGSPLHHEVIVPPQSRMNVSTGPGTLVPGLANEEFGAVITSNQPIAVERAMYSDANGQIWAAGTSATATALP
jgi:autotransporter-associated beta strand protein